MKIQAGSTEVVIGKRVAVGTAITSAAAALAHFYPEQAPAIMSAAVPATFIVQVLIGHFANITIRNNNA